MTTPALARPSDIAFRPVVENTGKTITIPAPRATPALDMLKVGDPATKLEIDCRTAIGPELAASARQIAYAVTTNPSQPELYDRLRSSAVAVRQLAQDTVEESNRVINELFERENYSNLNAAAELLRDLRKDMRKLTTKYNPGDPKVLQKYMDWEASVMDKVRGIKTLGQLIMIDVQPLKSQMHAVEDKADDHLEKLDDTLAYYDEMLELVENEAINLMYAIAVMEYVLERATSELEAMPKTSPTDPLNTERDKLGRFVRDMDTKVNDFKSRLWLDAANGPRILEMQSITQSVALRMVAIITLVIPSMKAAIVDWNKTANTVEAAQFINLVNETFNEVIQANNSATAAAVPIMLRATETPLLTIESVHSFGQMFEDVAAAVEAEVALGAQRKAELRTAQAEVLGKIVDTKERITETYVRAALEAGNVKTPLALTTAEDVTGSTNILS